MDTLPAADKSPEEVLALVGGKPLTCLPSNLYIPPDALEVFLDAFEGPLDLLLYLIRRQNLDILDIEVSLVTEQYVQYIDMMQELQLDLAAEYLVMAALLADIKSRSLLPMPVDDEEDEEADPRAALVRRLQEYENFRRAAEALDDLPRLDRDFWVAQADLPAAEPGLRQPDVSLQELLLALSRVLARADMYNRHQVLQDPLSTRERMSEVLSRLHSRPDELVPFVSCFSVAEGRMGVIVTFLAIVELLKDALIELVQNGPFAPIHLRERMSATSRLAKGELAGL